MLDIPSITGIVAAIGVIVGVVFTVLELRNLVQTRQTDLIMRLYSTYGSKEFLEATSRVTDIASGNYEDFVKKYGYADVLQVGTFFEGLGVLLRRKLIGIQLADDLFSEPVKTTWRFMEHMIETDRKRLNQPRIFEWFEYLAVEIQKKEQQQASKTA